MLLAVPNVSEGRDRKTVSWIGGHSAVDVHSDPDHNRSVLTYAGADLVEVCVAMTARAAEVIDLRRHSGAHPRVGAVDVLPFVPYPEPDWRSGVVTALAAAQRIASELGIPTYLYGHASPGNKPLPSIRTSFERLGGGIEPAEPAPDFGPRTLHPTAGATCVGVRGPLVAFNVNLRGRIRDAKDIARAVRSSAIRALGFELPSRGLVQVSMNLVDPFTTGPRAAFQSVSSLASRHGAVVVGAEIAGLVPGSLEHELAELPLAVQPRTIENATASV